MMSLFFRSIVGCCVAIALLSGCSSSNDSSDDVVASESPYVKWTGTFVKASDGWCENINTAGLVEIYGHDPDWTHRLTVGPKGSYELCLVGFNSISVNIRTWLYSSEDEAARNVSDNLDSVSTGSVPAAEFDESWVDGVTGMRGDLYYRYGRQENIIVEAVGYCGRYDNSDCSFDEFVLTVEEMADQTLAFYTP